MICFFFSTNNDFSPIVFAYFLNARAHLNYNYKHLGWRKHLFLKLSEYIPKLSEYIPNDGTMYT